MEFEWEDIENLEDRFIESMGVMGRYIADSVDNSLSIFHSSSSTGGNVSVVGSFAKDSRAFMGETLKHQDIIREMSRRFFSTTTYQLGLIHNAAVEQGKNSDFFLQRVASRLNFIKENLTLSALSGVAKIATSVYRITSGILFGRKDRRSDTQKIVDSIERLTNLIANGRVQAKRSSLSGGVAGIVSQGFKRRIGLGANRAAETEEKRARGESTTFADRLSQSLNWNKYSVVGKTSGSRADATQSNSNRSVFESIRDILYNSDPISVELTNGDDMLQAIRQNRVTNASSSIHDQSSIMNAVESATAANIQSQQTQQLDKAAGSDIVTVDNLDDKSSSPLSSINDSMKNQVRFSNLQKEHEERMEKHSSLMANAANDTRQSTERSEDELKKIRKQVWYMTLLSGAVNAIKSLWVPLAAVATYFTAGKFKDGIKNAIASGWGVLRNKFGTFFDDLISKLKNFINPKDAVKNAAKTTAERAASSGAGASGSVIKNALGKVPGVLGKVSGFLRAGPLSGIFSAGSELMNPEAGDRRFGRDNLIKAGSRGTGATLGAVVGGGLGSFLGPLGLFAGGAAGGYVGDKLGKAVGSVLASEVAESIGNLTLDAGKTIVNTAYDAVFGSENASNRSRELQTSLDENSDKQGVLNDTLDKLNATMDRLNRNVEKTTRESAESVYNFIPGLSQQQSAHVSGDS